MPLGTPRASVVAMQIHGTGAALLLRTIVSSPAPGTSSASFKQADTFRRSSRASAPTASRVDISVAPPVRTVGVQISAKPPRKPSWSRYSNQLTDGAYASKPARWDLAPNDRRALAAIEGLASLNRHLIEDRAPDRVQSLANFTEGLKAGPGFSAASASALLLHRVPWPTELEYAGYSREQIAMTLDAVRAHDTVVAREYALGTCAAWTATLADMGFIGTAGPTKTAPSFAKQTIWERAAGKVPQNWDGPALTRKAMASEAKFGLRWRDPKSGSSVRIDRGNPASPFPSQRVDHVVINRRYTLLGPDGLPRVSGLKANPEAHIPLTDWINWKAWDRP